MAILVSLVTVAAEPLVGKAVAAAKDIFLRRYSVKVNQAAEEEVVAAAEAVAKAAVAAMQEVHRLVSI